MSRKTGVLFEPGQVLRYVEEPDAVRSHEQLVRDYLEVRSSTLIFHFLGGGEGGAKIITVSVPSFASGLLELST